MNILNREMNLDMIFGNKVKIIAILFSINKNSFGNNWKKFIQDLRKIVWNIKN